MKLTSVDQKIFLIQNLSKDINWFTAEINKMQMQKALLEKKLLNQRKVLMDALSASGKAMVETEHGTAQLGSYESIVITDEETLISYLKVGESAFLSWTPKLDKKGINAHVKEHGVLPGTEIVKSKKLTVTKPGQNLDFSGAEF